MPAEFEYVVWFQDPSMPPDDENFEWPAVFVIVARNSEAALQWGDVLSKSYAARTDQVFLSSKVDNDPSFDSRLPRVSHGELATDQQIGW